MNKYDKETNLNNEPNTTINTQKTFNLRANMEIPAYSEPDKYVPEIDKNYHFDEFRKYFEHLELLLYLCRSPK